jgi:hypothetical protein
MYYYVNSGPRQIRCFYSYDYLILLELFNTTFLCFYYLSTIGSTLYCSLAASCDAHQPAYLILTLVPVKSNVITVLHIQSIIFDPTYLRCYCGYVVNSMRVILLICCQIQRASADLCYVNSVPCQIQRNCSFTYSGFNIQINVSVLRFYCRHVDNFMRVMSCPALRTTLNAKKKLEHVTRDSKNLIKNKRRLENLIKNNTRVKTNQDQLAIWTN